MNRTRYTVRAVNNSGETLYTWHCNSTLLPDVQFFASQHYPQCTIVTESEES